MLNKLESSVEKSVPPDQLPDFGLIFPESPIIIEKRRYAVVSCVNELLQPDNYQGFRNSVIAMFGAFNMQPSTLAEDIKQNETGWEIMYRAYYDAMDSKARKGEMIDIDLEMRGVGKSYANVYFDFYKIGNIKATLACPGICSLPYDVSPVLLHVPERNFYDVFERTIGIDPNKEISGQSRNLFFVIGKSYLILPAPIKPPRLGRILPKLARLVAF